MALILSTAAPAAAQGPPGWGDTAYVNVNLALQLASREFVETIAPTIYGEKASIVTSHAIDSGMTPLDIGGGVRVWKNLGVGFTYTRLTLTNTASVAADVPHPTQFGRPRLADVRAPLERIESSIHIQALWMLQVSQRFDVALVGGPSLTRIQQDLVSGIKFAENSPTFATVEISEATVVTRSGNGRGFNAGADMTFFLKPMFGLGATVRYTSGSVTVVGADGLDTSLDMGGLQIGFGARIRLK